MVHEIELKLRVQSPAMAMLVEQRCRLLATDVKDDGLQQDEYFDTPDEELRQRDFTVRIRSIQGRVRIALKGPRIHEGSGVHRRIELEFDAPDYRALRAQLDAQGLIRTAVIEKYRYEFSIQGCLVALDTLPFIGVFIEIEGPHAKAIEAVRLSLELSTADPVVDNYTELLEKTFLASGRPVRPRLVATFAAERGAV